MMTSLPKLPSASDEDKDVADLDHEDEEKMMTKLPKAPTDASPSSSSSKEAKKPSESLLGSLMKAIGMTSKPKKQQQKETGDADKDEGAEGDIDSDVSTTQSKGKAPYASDDEGMMKTLKQLLSGMTKSGSGSNAARGKDLYERIAQRNLYSPGRAGADAEEDDEMKSVDKEDVEENDDNDVDNGDEDLIENEEDGAVEESSSSPKKN